MLLNLDHEFTLLQETHPHKNKPICKWCMDEFGPDTWSWDVILVNEIPATCYRFAKIEDRILFQLTWG